MYIRASGGMRRHVFDKFNSAEFRENNDKVYYTPPLSRAAEFRGVIYAHMHTCDACMSRARDIFVLMRLLFGNKTFVKPDV